MFKLKNSWKYAEIRDFDKICKLKPIRQNRIGSLNNVVLSLMYTTMMLKCFVWVTILYKPSIIAEKMFNWHNNFSLVLICVWTSFLFSNLFDNISNRFRNVFHHSACFPLSNSWFCILSTFVSDHCFQCFHIQVRLLLLLKRNNCPCFLEFQTNSKFSDLAVCSTIQVLQISVASTWNCT